MSETTRRISEFKDLVQVLASAPDENARLKLAVEAAVALVPRCVHAGVTVNQKRVLSTRTCSDSVVRRANDLQNMIGEGPCLDLGRDQNTLISTVLGQDERWPRWASRVHAELGVESMMSLRIYTDQHSFGALSMYAGAGQRFDADDVVVGQAIAAHLAVIVAAEREIDHLGVGMHNRLIIGQAEGILMERLDVTAEQAFDYLRRISSHSNRKLVHVASDIARTRALPDFTSDPTWPGQVND